MICANDRVQYDLLVVFLFLAFHYRIIIIMQAYLEELWTSKNAYQVHSIDCVPTIRSIYSIIFHTI